MVYVIRSKDGQKYMSNRVGQFTAEQASVRTFRSKDRARRVLAVWVDMRERGGYEIVEWHDDPTWALK